VAVVIALEAVSASIGQRPVLSEVSVAVAAGEVVALCGPNGAGKSSAIRAACGLLVPSSGTVRLGNDPIRTLDAPERAARIAYLPQDRRIAWNMPAIEIAGLGSPFLAGDEARRRALEALAEMEAEHLADRGVAEMSGGERARVLIARTLATRARALTLDEPVAGLDPEAQYLVMDRLRTRAAGGHAVLVSLHDLSLAAEYADRIVVLDGGRVVADASPPEALSAQVLADVFRIDGAWIDGPRGPLLMPSRRAQGA